MLCFVNIPFVRLHAWGSQHCLNCCHLSTPPPNMDTIKGQYPDDVMPSLGVISSVPMNKDFSVVVGTSRPGCTASIPWMLRREGLLLGNIPPGRVSVSQILFQLSYGVRPATVAYRSELPFGQPGYLFCMLIGVFLVLTRCWIVHW